jgi:hypothetical protein
MLSIEGNLFDYLLQLGNLFFSTYLPVTPTVCLHLCISIVGSESKRKKIEVQRCDGYEISSNKEFQPYILKKDQPELIIWTYLLRLQNK